MFRWALHKTISSNPEAALEVLMEHPDVQLSGSRKNGWDGPFRIYVSGITYKFYISHELSDIAETELIEKINCAAEKSDEKFFSDAEEDVATRPEKDKVRSQVNAGIKPQKSTLSNNVSATKPRKSSKSPKSNKKKLADTLLQASQKGQRISVKQLVQKGADLNHRDEHGNTALIYAALHGNAVLVQQLLEDGANPRICAFNGRDALHAAKQNNHHECARIIIEFLGGEPLAGIEADVTNENSDVTFDNETLFDLAERYWTKNDYIRALKLYLEAAHKGSAEAANTLACMYSTGDQVEPDEIKSLHFLKLAAELGHENAQCDLGYYFLDKTTGSQNLKSAVQWFEESAFQGNADAMLTLIEIYSEEGNSFTNQSRADYWIQKARSAGHLESHINTSAEAAEKEKEWEEALPRNSICDRILLGEIIANRTNSDVVGLLSGTYPKALRKAQDLLVAIKKKNAGGGLFSSANTRIKNAQLAVYALENSLFDYGFDTLPANLNLAGKSSGSIEPQEMVFIFMNFVAQAYPNWRPEYEELNRFIPQLY